MAYGLKRWVLSPPYNGTIYSVKPSINFFQDDLPTLQKSEIDGIVSLLHFTQHSGDIVVLPREWGHATVNIESSIGTLFLP